MFNNPFTTEFDDRENKEETLPNNRKREGLDAVTPMDSAPLNNRGDPLPLQEEDLPDHLKDPKRPDTLNPEGEVIKFYHENLRTENAIVKGLPPEELPERSFLMPCQDDSTRNRAKIIELIENYKKGMEDHPEQIKFKC